MTGKRVSIRDVSARAGVSAATVSNVFGGTKPVNAALEARVREAAAALGYEPDRAASQLRSGRTRVVVVLVPDLRDTFFASLVTRIESLAQDEGYDVVVASSRDDRGVEASRLAALLAWRPAGILVVPCSNEVPAALARGPGRPPVVLVDRVSLPSPFDTVTLDNRDAGEIAARHLVDQGHRDILLVASRMDIAPIAARLTAAAEHIERETGHRATILELGSAVERGAALCARWLERHSVPDAVIAATNVTTLAVLTAFAQFRIAIPDRSSLVAFDDDAWMGARNTGLTAVRQPVDAMAEAAWARLLVRMRGSAEAPPVSIVHEAELIVRASVAPRERSLMPVKPKAPVKPRAPRGTAPPPKVH